MGFDNKVTVSIPERLYDRLKSIATENNQDVADVLLASAQVLLSVSDDDKHLPTDVADELAAMQHFSDQALWEATQPRLSDVQQNRLDALIHKQANASVTETEQKELFDLLADYDRSVLYRAQAFALLSLRGHTIPNLNEPIPT